MAQMVYRRRRGAYMEPAVIVEAGSRQNDSGMSARRFRLELTGQLGPELTLRRLSGAPQRAVTFRVDRPTAILKVFPPAQAHKQAREVLAYGVLHESAFAAPKLLDHGVFSTGDLWILLTFESGAPISDFADLQTLRRTELPGLFACVLRQFHVATHEASRRRGPPLRQALTDRLGIYRNCIRELRAAPAGLDSGVRKAIDLVERLEPIAATVPDSSLGLIHGDFCSRNLLAWRRPRPLRTTVLIDFERSGFGDILEDLSGPFVTDFGRDEMNWSAFLASYGALDGPQGVERELYYLAARTVEIATWAPDRDPNFYRATLEAFARVAGDGTGDVRCEGLK
jgi:aminoglycoside phosphotransferase (APT) family kinase protein